MIIRRSFHSTPALLRKVIALVALVICTQSITPAWAATWRSTLYPSNWTPPTTARFETDKLLQDFSYAGYHMGTVDIPLISGPVFDVTSYGADPSGVNDSTVAIQNAINAAQTAGGGVVNLPAGTFKVKPQGTNSYALLISANNVVLRGAGIGQTFLFNDSFSMRSKHIIRVQGSSSSWSTVPTGSPQPTITSDLLSPTTSIPVSSVTGFAVGNWIIVRADATTAFIAEHSMGDLWDASTGLGGVMFCRQIKSIDTAAKRLGIDVPTRYYLKVRDNARVHLAVSHIEEVGLEGFSIGNREHSHSNIAAEWNEDDYDVAGTGAYDVHSSYAISLRRARNCWVLNVATYHPSVNTTTAHILSNGIEMSNCRGLSIDACDFSHDLYGGGGGNGYMYRFQNSQECLVINSAARYHRHGFVFASMQCSGNVIRGGIAQVSGTQMAAGTSSTSGDGCDHHMHLSQSNLVDSVQLDRDYFAAFYRGTYGGNHGQTAAHSVFWNLEGLAYKSGSTSIARSQQARYGYLIGSRGAAPGLSTALNGSFPNDVYRTDPVDHLEGQALGDTLVPASLYDDQLARRLSVLGTNISVADGFHNAALPSAQTGAFTAQFDATPSLSPSNTSIALCQGAQTTYTGLAAIVRFNPTGTIDARNGGAYAAATTIPFSAGVTYHFRLVVNVPAHTYSAYVTPAGGSEITIGLNYAFRTEQAGVTSLDTFNVDVNATPGGSVWVTSPAITPAPPAAAPTFSPGGGSYTSAQNVTISSATSGATIRYTTNGTTPTSTSGTVYAGPVAIGSTTTLKAIAYKSGLSDSTVTTANYTINIGSVTITAANGFYNTPMSASKTGTFTATFDAVPSLPDSNVTIALCKGAQTAYTGLAAIARFNAGVIDARNGGVYAAASTIPYSAGVSYHFRLVVNVTAHTYSIYVTPAGGSELTVGLNYAFRTEQNTVTSLDTWNIDVNPAPGGSVTVSNRIP